MCITPNHVWVKRGLQWEKTPKPCGDCWRCESNYINDFVGRCLAEAATSVEHCAVTLTYAPRDDLAEQIPHPEHFQVFIRMLRRAGHKIRYLVAAEFGELKGRVHFHALLFFSQPIKKLGCTPRYKDDYKNDESWQQAYFCREIPNKRMVHIREWPHGHIKLEWGVNDRNARYACKYFLKQEESWKSLSKKPTLGHEWFKQKAQRAIELGVYPRSFEYMPPGGELGKKYLMTGATRRDYLKHITDHVDKRRETMSEWVGKTFDKHARDRVKKEFDNMHPDDVWMIYEDLQNIERRSDYFHKLDRLTYWMSRSATKTLKPFRGDWLPPEEIERRLAAEEYKDVQKKIWRWLRKHRSASDTLGGQDDFISEYL